MSTFQKHGLFGFPESRAKKGQSKQPQPFGCRRNRRRPHILDVRRKRASTRSPSGALCFFFGEGSPTKIDYDRYQLPFAYGWLGKVGLHVLDWQARVHV